MQLMGAGFSVSESLCCKSVGASLSIGYSFNDALGKIQRHQSFKFQRLKILPASVASSLSDDSKYVVSDDVSYTFKQIEL